MQASLDDSDQKTSGTMQMTGCKVIVRPKAFEQQVLAWRLATFALWLFITGTWAVLPYPAAGRVGLLCPSTSLQNLLSLRVWGSSLGIRRA